MEQVMDTDDNYVHVYLSDQLEKAAGNQSLHAKRLFEYNMAKEAGDKALKELAIQWYTENSEQETPQNTQQSYEQNMSQNSEQNTKDIKWGKIGFWIGIIFLIGLFAKIFL